MLQRLIDTAGLPETGSDLPDRMVLMLGVASLALAVTASLL
jgi:hypothetical protein